MKSDAVKTQGVFNQSLGDANTVTAVDLPGGTYHLYIRGRTSDGNGAALRIHPTLHQNTVYFTVPAGETLHIDRLHLGAGIGAAGKRTRRLYVSSPTGNGVIAEALTWE